MTSRTPPIVLFTYDESVVGRRLQWYLTLRRIPYAICRVDAKMPRPVFDRLDVHYRRIPVLAVGRDIYCDSRCIIDRLETLYTHSPRLGASRADHPFQHGIERVLEAWAFDGGLFMKTAQLITSDASLVQNKAWLADRSELTGAKYDAEALKQTLPVALSNARLHLQLVENDLLADGRQWLGGGSGPGLSDIHVLWIFDWMLRPKELMGMQHAYPEILNEQAYPKTFAWVRRMDTMFHAMQAERGKPKVLPDDEAVRVIGNATLWEPPALNVDENDPTGLKRGEETDLIALDSAPDTGIRRRDVGKLEGLSVTSVAIGTTTENGQKVRIHYPRTNVRVAKAGGGPRLKASQIP